MEGRDQCLPATAAGPPHLTIRVTPRGMITAELDGETEHAILDDLEAYGSALAKVDGTAAIVASTEDSMAGLIARRAQRILEKPASRSRSTEAMPRFDVEALRAEFPALRREQDGRPVAFLDGPGGTQVPQRVIDAVGATSRTRTPTPVAPSPRARRRTRSSTRHTRPSPTSSAPRARREIKFGYNMSTLTLHIGRSIGATLTPGDEIVVTRLDHEANVSTWEAMAADRGLTVHKVDISEDDVTLDLEDLDRSSAAGRSSSPSPMQRAVGTINPVREIIARAHEVGALAYVDAVAYAPRPDRSAISTPTSSSAARTNGSVRTLVRSMGRPMSSTRAGAFVLF